MRRLVGPTDVSAFDNPGGSSIYPYLEPSAYESVFDFGCGCGRVARQMIQQRDRPRRYVGIDLHAGMIKWCKENLQPFAPGFEFMHHDVFNAGFNPDPTKPATTPFPVEGGAFTLVQAWSVFTHLTQPQVEFYLHEVARVLRSTGVLHSTWFLFDKTTFPMMHEFQNALYINVQDPSNAVIFDKTWLRAEAAKAGLTIFKIFPPEIRGFQWKVLMSPARAGLPAADFPPDDAEVGLARPPDGGKEPHTIGL